MIFIDAATAGGLLYYEIRVHIMELACVIKHHRKALRLRSERFDC